MGSRYDICRGNSKPLPSNHNVKPNLSNNLISLNISPSPCDGYMCVVLLWCLKRLSSPSAVSVQKTSLAKMAHDTRRVLLGRSGSFSFIFHKQTCANETKQLQV
ncbi:hypothetical protein NQD34_016566 [Periophthalmus magnuspinnatus]|nr:hypothetical protein NQD34_016566 [Periophthalmus magnuspinnatus]